MNFEIRLENIVKTEYFRKSILSRVNFKFVQNLEWVKFFKYWSGSTKLSCVRTYATVYEHTFNFLLYEKISRKVSGEEHLKVIIYQIIDHDSLLCL